MKSLTKNEFLEKHCEALQQQIWLLEIDQFIMRFNFQKLKEKKDIDQSIEIQNKLATQINSLNIRRQFVIKLMHEDPKVVDTKTPDKPTNSV